MKVLLCSFLQRIWNLISFAEDWCGVRLCENSSVKSLYPSMSLNEECLMALYHILETPRVHSVWISTLSYVNISFKFWCPANFDQSQLVCFTSLSKGFKFECWTACSKLFHWPFCTQFKTNLRVKFQHHPDAHFKTAIRYSSIDFCGSVTLCAMVYSHFI